jgi:ABC-2 type transport system permease protein
MSVDTRESAPPAGPVDRPTRAIARFEGRNRVPVSIVLLVLFSLFGGLYVWIAPEFVGGEVIQQLIDSMPPVMIELFGFESLESVEGLLGSEYYTFGWLVGLAGYLAYSAAGSLAGDVETARMDTLLAAPISRRSVVLGKYAALVVPIGLVNVAVPAMLFLASLLVGTPLAIGDLAVLHALSIPYLLAWAAVGVLLGILLPRGRTAGRIGLGLVFAGWLFESVIGTTDVAWLGAITPMRYFDPPAILVHGRVNLVGAGILLLAAVALLVTSLVVFERRDV